MTKKKQAKLRKRRKLIVKKKNVQRNLKGKSKRKKFPKLMRRNYK